MRYEKDDTSLYEIKSTNAICNRKTSKVTAIFYEEAELDKFLEIQSEHNRLRIEVNHITDDHKNISEENVRLKELLKAAMNKLDKVVEGLKDSIII